MKRYIGQAPEGLEHSIFCPHEFGVVPLQHVDMFSNPEILQAP